MTYDLRCPACGMEWSVNMPISMVDKGETPTCPKCDTTGEIQITGGRGVVLKGELWAKDVYQGGRKG
jgi:transcription elongation factor Elf1